MKSKSLLDLGYDIHNPIENIGLRTGNGDIIVGCLILKSLEVFGHKFEGVKVSYSDKLLSEDFHIDGVIGMGILASFDIKIMNSIGKVYIKHIKNRFEFIAP